MYKILTPEELRAELQKCTWEHPLSSYFDHILQVLRNEALIDTGSCVCILCTPSTILTTCVCLCVCACVQGGKCYFAYYLLKKNSLPTAIP